MSVHFVILFNDKPVPVTSVLIGLKTDCDEGSMNQAFGSEIGLTCKTVSSRSPNATSPTNSAHFDGGVDDSTNVEYTWVIAAISCVALLVLSIMLTLIFVRKRQRRKRLAIARASIRGDSAAHGEYVVSNEAMHNPIYEPTFTGGGIRNPIYCDKGDMDDNDDEGIYDNCNVNHISARLSLCYATPNHRDLDSLKSCCLLDESEQGLALADYKVVIEKALDCYPALRRYLSNYLLPSVGD
ncbi:uncharacterized protein [Oscarella lobularis]|uniref:uncharacterized protein n=1 Tax=Oscarella lobularis TaxID=121494 RepID=UPI003314244B